MGGHFTVRVSAAELSSAESLLGVLAERFADNGAKLSGLPGKATGWSGRTASVLKAEMTRLGRQLSDSPEHVRAAREAVAAFRRRVEEAQAGELAELNRRWDDSVQRHEQTVARAGSEYDREVRALSGMPPEEAAERRAELSRERGSMVNSAGMALMYTQRAIDADYQALMTELRTAARRCGEALSRAVLVAVPADVVARYAGNVSGAFLDPAFDEATAAARQALLGDASLAGMADDYRAGQDLAREVAAAIRAGEDLTVEQIAALKANSRVPGFAQGFLEGVGPQGAAAVAFLALQQRDGAFNADDKRAGEDLSAALTGILTLGSHVMVDDGAGGARYLMDDGWLENFNPRKAWPDSALITGDYRDGYRADLLLPFLTEKIDANLAKLIGERLMLDYERSGRNGVSPDFQARYHNLFDTGADGDLLHIVLDRVGEHTDASNLLMMRHFDTMMHLLTGQDPAFTGGYGLDDTTGDSLATILRQATLGQSASDQALADSVVSQLGAYLLGHKDDKLIGQAVDVLGDILLDPRYLPGQLSSITTPLGPESKGYDPVTGGLRDPRFGLLLPREVWGALDEQILADADHAPRLIAGFQQWVIDHRAEGGPASSFDPDKLGPDFQPLNDTHGNPYSAVAHPEVVSIDAFQQALLRAFLSEHLLAVQDDLQADLERRLEQQGKQTELAKAALGKVLGWVADPTSITTDLAGLPAAAAGAAIDAAVDGWAEGREEDLRKEYEQQLKLVEELRGAEFTEQTPWKVITDQARELAGKYVEGQTPPAVYTRADAGDPTVSYYNGDPARYVTGRSEYVGGGQVITDDFRTYGADGKVTGVVPVDAMNHLQRQAFDAWLHDPAVQSYLTDGQDILEEALRRANLEIKGESGS